MDIHVHDGDIAHVKADALVTAINSGGMWFGGIDGVIQRVAGNQFHGQAAVELVNNPSAKVVVAPMHQFHNGQFRNVVFTIDDLGEDLKDVVRRGLDAAADAGYRTVSLPAIRLGVMKDLGGSQTEKVRAMVAAIREHETDAVNVLDEVSVVIYNDSELVHEFIREFA